jgi:hypothetical protein
MNDFSISRTTDGLRITCSPIFSTFLTEFLGMLLKFYSIPLEQSEKLAPVLLGKVSYKTNIPSLEEDWQAERLAITSERAEAAHRWITALQTGKPINLSEPEAHLLIVCLNDLRLAIGAFADIDADDLSAEPSTRTSEKESAVILLHLLGAIQCDLIEQLG